MRKSRCSEEQVACVLTRAELGALVAEACREMGVPAAPFFCWRQELSGLDPSELRKLRQFEEENTKFKRLVADLSLDKAIIQEVLAKVP